MTTLNFALSRAASREWAAGDEIVCTRLDHDGNVAPWLELAHDQRPDRALRRRRRRVPARPRPAALAAHRAHARRRVPVGVERGRHGDAGRRDRRARARGRRARLGRRRALRAARPDRRRRPSAPTCSSARRTSSTGRTSGSRSAAASCSRRGGRTRCGPRRRARSATATRPGRCAHELLAGFVAAVEYLDDVGWDFVLEHERALGQQFLDGLPGRLDAARRRRRWTAACRRSRSRTTPISPAAGGRGAARRARLRRLARQLLRRRDHAAPRPAPTARSASASSTTTPRTRSTRLLARARRAQELRSRVARCAAGFRCIILAAAQFVMVLDSSVMNVSISQIVDDLDTTIQGVQTRDHAVHAGDGGVHAASARSSATSWAATGPSRSASAIYGVGLADDGAEPEPRRPAGRLVAGRGPRRGAGDPRDRGAHRRQLRGQGARARLRAHRRRRRRCDRRRPADRRLGDDEVHAGATCSRPRPWS